MERRDFFISYQNKDEAWAVWVARVLNGNGYSAYTQKLDILPGDDFLEKMEEFLENSDNFIAVWSKNYSKSMYCMNELRAAYHQCHNGRMNCLLPVLVDDYPIKALYSALVHVDLPDRSAASEAALADAVRRAVPRPLSVQDEEREAEGKRLYELGDDYYFGRGVAQDYAKARDCWEQSAAKDNADALNDLGYLYQHGLGVDMDYAKARDCYEQAGAKGNAMALNNLGYLYQHGLGIRRDYAKARNHYEQAAAKGSAFGLYNLGYLYDKGLGVAQDYAKARGYYEQSAAKGHVSALWNLGWMYEYGESVNVNYEKALDYYQKAADAGDKDAPARVAELRRKLNR